MQKKSFQQQISRGHEPRDFLQENPRSSEFAAGVRWFGVEDGEAVVHASEPDTLAGGATRHTLVFGSAHGPRLLEALGACAC